MARRSTGVYWDEDSQQWRVDKVAKPSGRAKPIRLQKRFGTDKAEAEAWLIEQLARLNRGNIPGRVRHTFEDAATHYLTLYENKLSIGQDGTWLEEMMPFIGDLPLDRIYDGTLKPFVEAQRVKPVTAGPKRRVIRHGVKSKTINLKLSLIRHILYLAARSWRDEDGQTWLPAPPLIKMVEGGDARAPRPLTWDEQKAHLHALPWHLYRMALFNLQCGVRDDVVCSLRWEWERQIPELDITAFIVPPEHVKGQRGKKSARVLVCNSLARQIVESCRGEHPEYVFVYSHNASRTEDGTLRPEGYVSKPPKPIGTMNNTAWQKWRARAGLGDLHVHDLRHTVGMRLREAGVGENTIAEILWHRRKSMTGHYSAAQVIELYGAVEKIRERTQQFNMTLATVSRLPTNSPPNDNADKRSA